MEKIYLKTPITNKIKSGHLWIFANQVESKVGISTGEIVELMTKDGISLGLAFYNPASKIRLRLLKCSADTNIKDLIYQRINIANKLRQKLFPSSLHYRLVFGESDLLPGLIIDRYGDYFVLQINSAGMEKQLDLIVDTICMLFPNCKGILTKNITSFRELENLPKYTKVLYGTIPNSIFIEENEIKYKLDLLSSQKTGLYLDQRLNRLLIQNLSHQLDVLDCYCNIGGFGLNALKGGASHVTFVDISKKAIEDAKENCKLNSFYNAEFVQDDVNDFLRNSYRKGKKWDLIILDPPSFAKNKLNLNKAIAGYSQINKYSIRLLKSEGFLATASCSLWIDETRFEKLIQKIALSQNTNLRLIFRGMQSPDHPILFSMPETKYLKFFIFQKIQ
ncbi:MAG: class I SAM-dependent rRNA methyltransferase [Candidatus Kapaibacteriales bacterium]